MKKLFALMLALMMTLACVSAVGAEDAAPAEVPAAADVSAASGSGTISLGVTLNGEIFAQLLGRGNAEMVAKVAAVVDLINSMNITMASDGVDAEMFVNINDEPIAGMAVLKDTDKLLILSDLFPNFILKIDQQGAASAMGGAGMQISMDPQQMEAMSAPVTKVMNDMMTKIGAPEPIVETFYDTVFTVKNPINMTTKEALQILLPAAKEIVSQQAFLSVLDQLKSNGMQINFSVEDLDKKIEEINNAKDEDLPVLDASVYSNEAQDGLFVIKVTKDGQTVEVNTGAIGGGFVNEVTVPDQAHVFVRGSQTEGWVNLSVQFAPQKGLNVSIDGSLAFTDVGFSGIFAVTMNDIGMGILNIEGTPVAVLSGAFGQEGKTEITIEDLQDQKSEKAQAFKADLMAGLMTRLARIVLAVPDLSSIMQQLMPQGLGGLLGK